MEKKIVIIGAGIAGLSAGCYARMNGYQAEIYESHSLPGGLCTAWKRKGYTIDGCLHWLTGSAPADAFYTLWEELGAVQNRRMFNHQAFFRYPGTDGRVFSVFCNADKLEAHMKELSPHDTQTIELFCRLIRKFSTFKGMPFKAPELATFTDRIKMMWKMIPYMKDLIFCNRITAGEFAARFRDPLLREGISDLLFDKDMVFFGTIMTMALLHNEAGGFPEGGSLEFARAIEKRFTDLGGSIYYNKKVEKILVSKNNASGIRLAGGEEISADYVISAADLRTTVYEMLDGRFIEPQHEELFRGAKLFPSSVQVSFGVDMDLSGEPDCVGQKIILSHPIEVGNQEITSLMLRNYCFDQSLAPKGKSVVETTFMINDFDYWEKLYSNKEEYASFKQRIADTIAMELELKFSGFRSKIEVTDVITPMTYVRYTGNYKGTYMTWVLTPEVAMKYRVVKKTLQGLENFWLSGMWVSPPGGVPTGAKSSREVIQLICRQNKKRFHTGKPF